MAPFVYLVVLTLINSWFAKRMGCLIMAGILPFTVFVVRDTPADRGLEPYGAGEPDAVDAATSQASALKTSIFRLIVIFIIMDTVIRTMSSLIPSYAESSGASFPAAADASGLIMATVQVGDVLGLLALGFINDVSLRLGVFVAGIALLLFFPAHILLMHIGASALGECYASTSIDPFFGARMLRSEDHTIVTSRVSAFGAGFAVIASPLWAAIAATPLGYAPGLIVGIVSCTISIAVATMALAGAKALAMDAGEAGMGTRDSRTPVSAG